MMFLQLHVTADTVNPRQEKVKLQKRQNLHGKNVQFSQ